MCGQHIRAGALAALLTGFLLASGAAAEPSLVRDLYPGTERIETYPQIYASRLVVDGVFYFPASDPAHGVELWRTDGTPAGTYRVTDLCPGPCDASPTGMQLFQGQIYFAANDGVSGRELWASDGTPGSARRVRDLCPGPCSSLPQDLHAEGERLLFVATSGSQWQLWSSDGSRQGTAPVRAFCRVQELPDSDPFSCIGGLTRLGGMVIFRVNNSYWRTDGTAAGTGPLSEVLPGLPGSFQILGRLGDSFILWAGNALWRTDGTAAGTRQLKTVAELGLDPASLSTGRSIVWKEMLFWEVDWGKILRTDGTPAGTFLLSDIPGSPNLIGFAALDDHLVMQFQLPESLWSTQGTPETTHQILDVPGYSYGLAAAGDTALVCIQIPGDVPTNELWLSDGTAEGTRRAPFEAGDCSTLDYAPNVGGRAIYLGAIGQLWGSDGTAAGTSIIHDFGEVPASSGPLEQIAFDGRLLFSARTSATEAPLFISDGSAAGTHVLSDEAGWARGLARAGNRVFFEAFEASPPGVFPALRSLGLWRTNGTPAGTVQVDAEIRDYRSPMPEGGALFFTAAREYSYYNQPDLELFRTDGTPGGTGLVKNINNYLADTGHHHICYNAPSTPGPGIDLNGRLLFVADDGRKGRELWVSDGTFPGTRLLRDINPRRLPGPPPRSCDDRGDTGVGSDPRDFIRYRNGVLFTAEDGTTGRELWWTDGTAAGTRRVADLRRGAQGSNPHDLVLFQGKVWFIASPEGTSDELWRTDGTSQGTVRVKPLARGGLPSWARSLTSTGNRLFFQVYNEATGAELWTSRGTAVSTRMVVDLRPGAAGSYPQALTAANGRLIFAADDGVHGLEPWTSDGTAAGTVLLGDIRPGLDASSPGPFTPVAGGLVLTGANDGEHGRELWAIEP